jgi:hypothetical protein
MRGRSALWDHFWPICFARMFSMPHYSPMPNPDERDEVVIVCRERAESWIEEALLSARETTRHRPFSMLLAAGGIGVLLGLIVGR